MPLPEIGAYRAAKILIDQHGDDAEAVAARSVGDAYDEGDTEKEAAWRMIRRAIEEFRRQAPNDGELMN